jgi:transcriptional regulator with XRE-family HTH domain
MVHLAANIKYLRDKHNLSQYAFATLFGLTRGKIASYEVGTEPALKTIVAISRHFKVNVDDLLTIDLASHPVGLNEAQAAQAKQLEESRVEKLTTELSYLKKENADLRRDKDFLMKQLEHVTGKPL